MNETVNYKHKTENIWKIVMLNILFILFRRNFITIHIKLDMEKDNWNVRFRV